VQVAVLNTIELEGASPAGWRQAAEEALGEAAKTLRNIRRLDVLGTNAVITDNQIVEYRTQVRLTFEVDTDR
jgi:dodecin